MLPYVATLGFGTALLGAFLHVLSQGSSLAFLTMKVGACLLVMTVCFSFAACAGLRNAPPAHAVLISFSCLPEDVFVVFAFAHNLLHTPLE